MIHLSEFNLEKHPYTERAVICFIVKEGKILLIEKKTGMGKGKVNAPGGKIEAGETSLEAAIRETQEEVCLTPKNLIKKGDLYFFFTSGYSLRGEVFLASDYEGEPQKTIEADPFWCKIEEIPFHRMWEDDQFWLPEILKGMNIKGSFIFDEDLMIEKNIIYF